MSHPTPKEMYNLACRVAGTCSFAAIWYGIKANRGWNKFRFLKSRYWEMRHRVEKRIWLWLRERRERKCIHAFATRKPGLRVGDVVKPIAFYLPQFHTFPENDAWWGKDFTEWTNVRKARPLFRGHYQPHVPHPDIGYYDLSDIEVMRRQAIMAKKYGVFGFCFYYYHFANGKRLLEKPVNNWLEAKDIDFPFCFCWANENWTRAWDGGDTEVIMPQDYGHDNMVAMFKNMLLAFADSRYIKVGANGNTPVLLIYRAEVVPEIASIVAEWRSMAQSAGFDGLFLVSVQNFATIPPSVMGLDASVEFPAGYRGISPLFSFMNNRISQLILHGEKILNAQPYENHIRWCERIDDVSYTRYKGVTPSWDNTPRKVERGCLFFDSSPRRFGKALASAARKTIADPRLSENGFLFLNAWNEWGEGAHLEPDMKNGYGYLEVLAKEMGKHV